MITTDLTPVPSRKSPRTFSDDMDTFLDKLPDWSDEANDLATGCNANALASVSSASDAASSASDAAGSASDAADSASDAEESALTALNAPGTSATSTTSLAIDSISQFFTLEQTGKSFAIGQYVNIAKTSAPLSAMFGKITEFNSGTGEMTVSVSVIEGEGTHTDWTISLSTPPPILKADPGPELSANLKMNGFGLVDSNSDSLVSFTGPSGGPIQFSRQVQLIKGADVASSTALPILTDGNYFDVTGTTTITSINTTGRPGTVVKLHFDGALTLTHHATDLILPGSNNIITEAGDELEFIEYDTGCFRCTNYSKHAGESLVLLETINVTSNVSSVDFTGIDGAYDEYRFVANNLTLSAAAVSIEMIIQTGGDTWRIGDGVYSFAGYGAYSPSSLVAYCSSSSNSFPLLLTNPTSPIALDIRIYTPSNTTSYKWINVKSIYSAGQTYCIDYSGAYYSTAALSGIRIKTNTQYISSGVFKKYGIK